VAVAAVGGLVLAPGLQALAGMAGMVAAAVLAVAAAALLAVRLPEALDGAFRRRPVMAALWTVLAIGTVAQTSNLSRYMIDPEYDYVHTTRQVFWAKHMCMNAYIEAADLNRQGEANVYDAAHYPGLTPDAKPATTVANLSPEDPFVYPPQFLLFPRLALEVSNDFFVIRALWFSVQALLFLGIAVMLARSLGGRAAAVAMFLIPILWISVPSMLNFQYGQFHVTTIALAVAAFVAFESRRTAAGGALLAASIVSKGFPGILLIALLFQKRWKAAAWTGAFATAFTALAWAVLGTDVFRAFFEYNLPRIMNGSAFAFEEAWPELTAPILSGNISPFSVVKKLEWLGVAGMSASVAGVVQTLFKLSVVALAALAARARSREARLFVWFALLNLAAMMSPASWGDYVPMGTVWLVTVVIAFRPAGAPMALVAAAGVMSFALPGVVPLGTFPGPVASMLLSIATTLLLLAINAGAVLRVAKQPHLGRIPVPDTGPVAEAA
jgi:hypothetical protein